MYVYGISIYVFRIGHCYHHIYYKILELNVNFFKFGGLGFKVTPMVFKVVAIDW